MPGMFDQWDERRHRATNPDPTPGPVPVLAGDALTRAERYARAALEGEIANIHAVPIGAGRNDQLNKSAMKMGHYVAAGAIDERTVIDTLGAADGGLDYPATAKTIRSGLDAGKQTPARIPDPATPSRVLADRPPWETPSSTPSDDPFSPDYTPPSPTTATNGGPAASTATTSTPEGPSSNPAAPSDPGESAPDAAETSTPTSHAGPDLDPFVIARAGELRRNREATRLVDHEDAIRDFRAPPYLATLADELALPDQPVTYAVDEVFPAGANVLLTAQYKTGKTTTINNLARSFVDGVPFLGRFGIAPVDGRVAVWNYEVDRDQYRRWMRDAGIHNADRVAVLNLRGYRMPLTVPYIETWVVEWLKRAEARVWIVDPFARAATGVDENSNTEVGAWLDTLDVIKGRAGVTELVLPNHTGRGEQETGAERGRGATRLDDWADVRWLLTRDKDDVRYYRATGRDVDVDEGALTFEPATRLLTYTGGSKVDNGERQVRAAVEAVLGNRPGLSGAELEAGVRQIVRSRSTALRDVVARMVLDGRVRIEHVGPAKAHFLVGTAPDPFA